MLLEFKWFGCLQLNGNISLLQTLSVTYDNDLICLSETFLSLPISYDNERSNIEGYITIFCGRIIDVTEKEENIHPKDIFSNINNDG